MSWIGIPFKDFITLQRGFDLPKSQMKDGDIPVFGSNCIIGYHNEPKVKGPGVITGRSGTLGLIQYTETTYWPHNTSLWVKNFKGNDPKFVFYKLKTLNLDRFNGGASVPTLNRNVLDTLPIKIPDINEQKQIASILSTYDDLIENNRRRIQLLEQAARLLYREWFVHLRFPGHEHVKIVDGVPEGWDKVPLGELLILQRGFDLPINQRKVGDTPVYGSTGIMGFHNKSKIRGPGVVTGRSGSLGTVIFISENFWPLNTTLWVKEFKRVGAYYAFHLLSTMKLGQYNAGAAVPTLNRNDVHKINVLCPPTKMQKLFEEQTHSSIRQVDVLIKMNKNLKIARDLLLPRLMNGEISL